MPDNPGVYTPRSPLNPNEVRPVRIAQPGVAVAPQLLKSVDAQIKAALGALPKGRRGAVVAHTDGRGVRMAVVGRKPGRFFGLLPPGEWSYVGTIGYSKGDLSGGAAVAYSW